MARVLVADIGGSNSRFALTDGSGALADMRAVDDKALPGIEDALAHYLEGVPERPRVAVLAVAAPVEGDAVALTNRPWRFSIAALARRFGFERLRVVNDFEAAAWSLLRLGPEDLRPIGPDLSPRDGVKAILGPGTGLGVAALVPLERGFRVIASEAGHVAFGPRGEDEVPVFRRLFADGPVSAETLLSGPGLVRLARALDAPAALADPETIVTRARAGDYDARAVVRLFVRLLGRFAGDMALVFRATGGVYLAGGVGRALGALLNVPEFRAAFADHPPYRDLLATIPTRLVTAAEPGLIGCAVLAENWSGAR